jgi:Mrp family chromosome partitioning ATPase
LLGFFAGVGLVILLERLHRRVRTHEDAEEAFGLPVLAEVPRFARSGHYDIVAATSPMSRAAESYRAVRSSLLFARAAMIAERAQMGRRREDDKGFGTSGREQPFVIMVASASPDEGKSTTTANLAAVFAEMGAKVLVVNCDFRRPAIHRYFGVPDHPRRVLDVEIPGVKLITNVLADPSANPSQVVAAQRQVVASSRARFDFILLDTAPLLAANDAVEIVGSADLVLLVARSEETRVDSARRVSELLQRLDAPLAGVVLTGVPGASDDASYYYYQGGPTAAPGAATPPLATGPSGER